MLVGGLAFFLILIIPAAGVTFLAVRNMRKEKEEENEI